MLHEFKSCVTLFSLLTLYYVLSVLKYLLFMVVALAVVVACPFLLIGSAILELHSYVKRKCQKRN